MNKKQFAITMLLLLLMGCITLGQRFFCDKMVNLAVNNDEYKNYSVLDRKYIYSFPEEYTVKEKQASGSFIIHYNEFNYNNNSISGYVKLLKSDVSIDDLSKRNINIIKEESKNKNIITSDFKTNKYTGIKTGYDFRSSTGKVYSVSEYMFKLSDGYIVKYAFVIDKDDINTDMEKDIFVIIDKFREK